jgi:hypothetical protein
VSRVPIPESIKSPDRALYREARWSICLIKSGTSMMLIDGRPEVLLAVHDALGKAHIHVSLTQVTLLAPILNPPGIFSWAWLI